MLKNVGIWLPSYLRQLAAGGVRGVGTPPRFLIFSLCDHFEPYWQNRDHALAEQRVAAWRKNLPEVALCYTDSCGQHPQHMFYFPIEEYRKPLLDLLGELEHRKMGEVEIHLHHDNDTADNLRKTLLQYKDMLRKEHGLLSVDSTTGETRYAFIHGNWALDNSRPDGRYCGVQGELEVLQQTGCYADFTLPSAPSDTQTRTINSIYYVVGDPGRCKAHDAGAPALAGIAGTRGLLCIQGPLCPNTFSRKYGILPRIENAAISADYRFTTDRLRLWLSANVHLSGRPDVVFIKTHTHGTQPEIYDYLFKAGGLHSIYSSLSRYCHEHPDCHLIFASSRQMYNIIKGLEADPAADPRALLDFRIVKE